MEHTVDRGELTWLHVVEARDECLSAEVGRIRQQMESAGVNAAASQQSAEKQMQKLHSWAHSSMEALQARSSTRRPVFGDHVDTK